MKLTPEEFRERFSQHRQPQRKQDANLLTTQVIRIARAYGVDCWRQNNSAIYDRKLGRYRAFKGRRGVSDVIGVLPSGRWFAAEIKAGKDRLLPAQKDFLSMVEKAGGFADCVRDIVEFEKNLSEYLDK